MPRTKLWLCQPSSGGRDCDSSYLILLPGESSTMSASRCEIQDCFSSHFAMVAPVKDPLRTVFPLCAFMLGLHWTPHLCPNSTCNAEKCQSSTACVQIAKGAVQS